MGAHGQVHARVLKECPETGRATLKVYKISPRGFPIEKVVNNDPYGDPELRNISV